MTIFEIKAANVEYARQLNHRNIFDVSEKTNFMRCNENEKIGLGHLVLFAYIERTIPVITFDFQNLLFEEEL